MARVTIDDAAVEAFKAELADAYYRENYTQLITVMRGEAPKDTGLLRASGSIDPPRRVPGAFLLRFRFVAPYAVFVHEGHGWIFPKAAKALRWVTKQGVVVFASKVRPLAARPYLFTGFRRMGFRKVRRIKP
jgi:hypothetical protein